MTYDEKVYVRIDEGIEAKITTEDFEIDWGSLTPKQQIYYLKHVWFWGLLDQLEAILKFAQRVGIVGAAMIFLPSAGLPGFGWADALKLVVIAYLLQMPVIKIQFGTDDLRAKSRAKLKEVVTSGQ